MHKYIAVCVFTFQIPNYLLLVHIFDFLYSQTLIRGMGSPMSFLSYSMIIHIPSVHILALSYKFLPVHLYILLLCHFLFLLFFPLRTFTSFNFSSGILNLFIISEFAVSFTISPNSHLFFIGFSLVDENISSYLFCLPHNLVCYYSCSYV